MDTHTLTRTLDGLGLGEIRFAEQVSSTNEVGMMWLGQGAPDLSLVVADEQTAGRGRFDRRWVTRPGAALAMSLILRPTSADAERLRLFSALGAFGVADALEGLYALAPQIKWPNDVLLNSRKVAGILVETAWTGDRLEGMVIGIGVNVSPQAVPPPEEVQFPATSVEDALGRAADRWELLREMLSRLVYWRGRVGSPEFYAAWDGRLAFRGEWVHIVSGYDTRGDLEGRILGINPDGSLRLANPEGHELCVDIGDVHLRPTRSK
jgi:BirA family transcriptional regulator, biotin operon repressor / biotin---[acetyl-CoA-carboxylase] ligase